MRTKRTGTGNRPGQMVMTVRLAKRKEGSQLLRFVVRGSKSDRCCLYFVLVSFDLRLLNFRLVGSTAGLVGTGTQDCRWTNAREGIPRGNDGWESAYVSCISGTSLQESKRLEKTWNPDWDPGSVRV